MAAVALWPTEKAKSKSFHTAAELSFFKNHARHGTRDPLPAGEYFLPSTNCKGCHGHDFEGLANLNADGVDVNLYDDWETSMMGLAAIDPFWRAKVSHETLVNPGTALEAQTLCTGCHAPMGHYTAMFHGQPHYTMADLVLDSLGVNGVSCAGCHAIGDVGLGSMFSGNIPFDTTKKLFGPFPGPFIGPMELYVGMIPTYAPHVSEGKFCSPCHTLVTKTVDLNGNYTGGSFVEQATYHEWLNSDFPMLGLTCQKCHMPQLEEAVVIANGYANLSGRSPFNQHVFAGGNAFMVNLIKQNKTALGVSASDAQFDSTLSATYKMLQQQTMDLTLVNDNVANDTASFTVTLLNKAGHKFPSGYPSRRAVVQFIVTKPNGDTLFASGLFDAEQRVIGEPDFFEPHRNVINSESQTQIYELVMADVNGDRTTVLERAATPVKDNRLPPAGFTTTHASYDTMKIVGATADADFNKNGLVEGTGSDKIQYRVALNGYTGTVNVQANVWYQSVPPKWLDEMFAHSSTEIDAFKSMYENADGAPILVAHDTIQNLVLWTGATKPFTSNNVSVYPTPTYDGVVTVLLNNAAADQIELLNSEGQMLRADIKRLGGNLQLTLPKTPGVYYLKINIDKQTHAFKLLRL